MTEIEHTRNLLVASAAGSRSIAYLKRSGNAPGILWLQGFRSEMTSIKATHLDGWAAAAGLAYTRFDYSGHGQSGGRFEDGMLSHWFEEASTVLDQLTTGPQIIVGSSMGGHLALQLAHRRMVGNDAEQRSASRIAGLVLIAPAWNMTELMWQRASPEARQAITADGVWHRPSRYGDEPYPITRDLIEDGRNNLLPNSPWDPGCPIEIIHGRLDPDVPYSHTENLVTRLNGQSVNVSIVEDGEHRLSRPEDLQLLTRRIEALIAAMPGG